MTIASEITRLQGAKASIKTSIGNKGVTVPNNATLDTYSGYIDQIQSASNPPLSITGATTYGGTYMVGNYQYISHTRGCASYTTDNFTLVGYVGKWDTYDGYDQADVHLIRYKPGVSRKEGVVNTNSGYTYTLEYHSALMTKESDDSYLFTAKVRYFLGPDYYDYYRWCKCQIRYTVSTDTLTRLEIETASTDAYTDPWPDIVNNDMHLYTVSDEISGKTRVALFNLQSN